MILIGVRVFLGFILALILIGLRHLYLLELKRDSRNLR